MRIFFMATVARMQSNFMSALMNSSHQVADSRMLKLVVGVIWVCMAADKIKRAT